jgi:disulfide oxidoreductase YuzD
MKQPSKQNLENIWLKEPEDHDFPAAQDYLELVYEPAEAAKIVKKLKTAKTIVKKSKDIFRASTLNILPADNKHIQANIQKIVLRKKLSPILLVRDNGKVVIADGYHRLCCSYYLTEDLDVPCRLVTR